MPKLRERKALPKWIMQVTAHKCFHRQRQILRTETSGDDQTFDQVTPPRAEEILRQAADEQTLREALLGLPARCRDLIRMLFLKSRRAPTRK